MDVITHTWGTALIKEHQIRVLIFLGGMEKEWARERRPLVVQYDRERQSLRDGVLLRRLCCFPVARRLEACSACTHKATDFKLVAVAAYGTQVRTCSR